LFVPGRKDLLEKAVAKGFKPDVLVPDMEDSVRPNEKVAARKVIAEILPEMSKKLPSVLLVPRVNSLDTGMHKQYFVSTNLTTIRFCRVD